jgi:hypothetical protein
MRAIVVAVAAASLLSVTTSTVQAQDEKDVAAWFAMMFTPYGALPPIMSSDMSGRPADAGAGGTFEVKYGHWGFDEAEEPWNIFGLGGRAGRFGFTVGYARCEGCGGDGIIMGQVDFESVLATAPYGTDASAGSFAIGLRPSVGFGKPTGDQDGYALAANLDLPVSFSVPMGARSRIVPFIAPGLGIGHLSGGEEGEDTSDTGFRGAIAAGVGVFVTDRFGIHVGWRKIFIEEGPSTLGVGLSFGR